MLLIGNQPSTPLDIRTLVILLECARTFDPDREILVSLIFGGMEFVHKDLCFPSLYVFPSSRIILPLNLHLLLSLHLYLPVPAYPAFTQHHLPLPASPAFAYLHSPLPGLALPFLHCLAYLLCLSCFPCPVFLCSLCASCSFCSFVPFLAFCALLLRVPIFSSKNVFLSLPTEAISL